MIVVDVAELVVAAVRGLLAFLQRLALRLLGPPASDWKRFTEN